MPTDPQVEWATSLRNAMCFWNGDWASERRLAWIYGIVVGWDDSSMKELSQRFGWNLATVEKLREFHTLYERAVKEGGHE